MSTMAEPSSLVPAGGYPPATNGIVVVWGLLGGFPFGGMTWQVLHHLAGLRALGFDVWYLEDLGVVMAPGSLDWTSDPSENVAFVHRQLSRIGLGDRWLFCPYGEGGEWYGAGDDAVARRLYRDAVAVINVCGARYVWEHEDIRGVLVYIDTDPGERQIQVASNTQWRIDELARYGSLFTYATAIRRSGCRLPNDKLPWQPTRPPVVVDWWDTPDPPAQPLRLTTISTWGGVPEQTLSWDGELYEWRKDKLFRRVLDLPAQSPLALELALRAIGDDEVEELRGHGWSVRGAHALDPPDAYRDYIQSSAGEFTVAKDQYTMMRTGWFSDRTACYLAAGRPVVTQDTGLEGDVPTGEGLLTFTTEEEAADAIATIAGNYEKHAAAARDIAREYFCATRLLRAVMTRTGVL